MASLNTKFFFQPTGFFLLALIHCTVLISANSVVRNRVKRDTAAATGGDWWRQQKADGTMEKFELRNADTSTMVKVTGVNGVMIVDKLDRPATLFKLCNSETLDICLADNQVMGFDEMHRIVTRADQEIHHTPLVHKPISAKIMAHDQFATNTVIALQHSSTCHLTVEKNSVLLVNHYQLRSACYTSDDSDTSRFVVCREGGHGCQRL